MLCSRVTAATCSSGVPVTTELQRLPVIGVTSTGDTNSLGQGTSSFYCPEPSELLPGAARMTAGGELC